MKKLLLIIALLPFGLVNAQIENGMVAHFPFNGNINDVSASAIVAINNGGVFGLDRNSVANNAIEFDGVSTYLGFNDNSVKVPLPLTLSTWFKFNSAPNPSNIIFTSDNVFDNYIGYSVFVAPSGQLGAGISGGIGGHGPNNYRSFISDTALLTGIWYHIAVVIRDYNDMEIHLNCSSLSGTYIGTGSTSIAYSATESSICYAIGGLPAPASVFFDASIDQLAIWDRELTPAEITFMCDINNPLSVDEFETTPKSTVKIVDAMGRETEFKPNTLLIYIYSDGTTEKVFSVE